MDKDPWSRYSHSEREAWQAIDADPAFVHGWAVGGWSAQTIPTGWQRLHHRAWGFCIIADVPSDPNWGALYGQSSPEFARLAFVHHKSAQEALALAQAVHATLGSEDPALFGERVIEDGSATSALLLRRAKQAADLNWLDIAACVRSGMNFDAAVAFVGSGADMEPVRLVAALSD